MALVVATLVLSLAGVGLYGSARWTLDPFAVAGVLATFAAATLVACYVPGRRALRIDPMQVLKGE
jgi:ABC-type antimicrobial peptide transport system permease subunit